MKLERTEFYFFKDRKRWRCQCTVTNYRPEGSDRNWHPSSTGRTRKEARENLEAKIAAKEIELDMPKKMVDTTIEETGKVEKSLVAELRRYAVLKQQGKIKKQSAPLKEGSINDKNVLIKNQVVPYKIGKIRVDKITRKDISNWLDDLEAAETSESRKKKAYNLVTDYFTNYYCSEVDLTFINPAVGFSFRTKSLEVDESHVLDDEECRDYLRACEKYGTDADIFRFMFYIYCREGEAATLKWCDWNKKRKTLHIHNTWTRNAEGKEVVDRERAKTKSSVRTIYLPIQVQELLSERYEQAKKDGWANPEDWIFPAIKDKRKAISRSTLSNIHKEICKSIHKKLRIYDLRHSGISFLIRNARDTDKVVGAISKIAGHKDPYITQTIYRAVLETEVKECANLMSALFENQMVA